MNSTLASRLDQIIPRITDPSFLSSKGIGNEIACYIFDYPAEAELQVRDHIDWMVKRFATHHAGLKVLQLNLFDVVIHYLKDRGLFDKALAMQARKGDAALLGALKGPLAAEKIRDFIAKEYQPQNLDLLLLSGVGSVWPMLRSHSLLNCLHTVMGQTPLVMFHPGTFDGTMLSLFGKITASPSQSGARPYYRAFHLLAESK